MTCMEAYSFNRKERQCFIHLLSDLLENGFSLEQSLSFMIIVMPRKTEEIKWVKEQVSSGMTLEFCLSHVGFTSSQLASIQFSNSHGDLVGTLKRMDRHMQEAETQRKELIKLLSYPVILLFFLSGMILGMKWYILPEMSDMYDGIATQSLGFQLIDKGPMMIAVFFALMLVSGYIWMKKKAKESELAKLTAMSRVPIIGKLVSRYYTSLFATEWGLLLTQGLEFREIILLMGEGMYAPYMKEMSDNIKEQLEQGESIDVPLKGFGFIRPELLLIVKQGEINGKLGEELVMYGKREWVYFVEQSEKIIRCLQPLMFVLIACLIVSIYGALLLPIYSGMSELS